MCSINEVVHFQGRRFTKDLCLCNCTDSWVAHVHCDINLKPACATRQPSELRMSSVTCRPERFVYSGQDPELHFKMCTVSAKILKDSSDVISIQVVRLCSFVYFLLPLNSPLSGFGLRLLVGMGIC